MHRDGVISIHDRHPLIHSRPVSSVAPLLGRTPSRPGRLAPGGRLLPDDLDLELPVAWTVELGEDHTLILAEQDLTVGHRERDRAS